MDDKFVQIIHILLLNSKNSGLRFSDLGGLCLNKYLTKRFTNLLVKSCSKKDSSLGLQLRSEFIDFPFDNPHKFTQTFKNYSDFRKWARTFKKFKRELRSRHLTDNFFIKQQNRWTMVAYYSSIVVVFPKTIPKWFYYKNWNAFMFNSKEVRTKKKFILEHFMVNNSWMNGKIIWKLDLGSNIYKKSLNIATNNNEIHVPNSTHNYCYKYKYDSSHHTTETWYWSGRCKIWENTNNFLQRYFPKYKLLTKCIIEYIRYYYEKVRTIGIIFYKKKYFVVYAEKLFPLKYDRTLQETEVTDLSFKNPYSSHYTYKDYLKQFSRHDPEFLIYKCSILENFLADEWKYGDSDIGEGYFKDIISNLRPYVIQKKLPQDLIKIIQKFTLKNDPKYKKVRQKMGIDHKQVTNFDLELFKKKYVK